MTALWCQLVFSDAHCPDRNNDRQDESVMVDNEGLPSLFGAVDSVIILILGREVPYHKHFLFAALSS